MFSSLLIVIEGKKMENYLEYIQYISQKITDKKELSEGEKLDYADFLVNNCSQILKDKYPTITRGKNDTEQLLTVSLEELREKEFEEE